MGINADLIRLAVDTYLSTHRYEHTEAIKVNIWYPIKYFQLGKLHPASLFYEAVDCQIIPSLEVTSIVVAPREPK